MKAALIPDERCVVIANFIFLLSIKMPQAISVTTAATYKVMELKIFFASLIISISFKVNFNKKPNEIL